MSFNLPNSIRRQCQPNSKADGFTLIELMVTVTVAIILAAVAIPQYWNIIQARKSVAEITNLYNDMQYSRTEAMKEGQNVTVCISSDQATCTGTNWKQGWIVFSDPGGTGTFTAGTSVLLKSQTAFTTTDTVATAPTAGITLLSFNRDGFAANVSTTTGLLFQLHSSTANAGSTRCLWISPIGNQYIQTTSSAAQTGQGTNTCT